MYLLATLAFWILALAVRGEGAGTEVTVTAAGAILNIGLLMFTLRGFMWALGWLGVEASFLACLFLQEAVLTGKVLAIVLVGLALGQMFFLWRVWTARQQQSIRGVS